MCGVRPAPPNDDGLLEERGGAQRVKTSPKARLTLRRIPAEEVVSQRLDLRRVDRPDLPRDRSIPGFTTRSRKALMVEPMRVRKG